MEGFWHIEGVGRKLHRTWYEDGRRLVEDMGPSFTLIYNDSLFAAYVVAKVSKEIYARSGDLFATTTLGRWWIFNQITASMPPHDGVGGWQPKVSMYAHLAGVKKKRRALVAGRKANNLADAAGLYRQMPEAYYIELWRVG